MTTKEQAKAYITELVKRFEAKLNDYKKNNYNETQTRIDYINPMFEALGWDIDNQANLLETVREVIHEAKVSTQAGIKAPDYGFTINGKVQFYLEAKKPSVVIKNDNKASYQARNYGWNKKLAISILTDFEEFAVYDCSYHPLLDDAASIARIKYIHFLDYEKEFEYLWNNFSKEKVFEGSIDTYAQQVTKKGADSVDELFLKTLNGFRQELATSIYINNPLLDEEQIKQAVQATIDRIIFLRICEDRGVEVYGTMQKCANDAGKWKVYANLFAYFTQADAKYNSGLFTLKTDKLTTALKIDNKILKNIIEELYLPKSPYLFAVMPADILGNAYEQFLGKIIVINPNKSITITDKPEVRKAGGVYYTPQYIVAYMVSSTLGEKIKEIERKFAIEDVGKEVSKLKLCDPSCGSGSFLLGAYQYLLDWYHSYYIQLYKINTQLKYEIKAPLTSDGKLTSLVKKEILLNNIFGVDIDANAVEVTKLSLLLKAMEGETESSIDTSLKIYRERVLPTLDDNIRSGNSLIDVDFYGDSLDFEPLIEKRIKPFSWKTQFAKVFTTKTKGFDIIIGNPPYINIENLAEDARNYYLAKYQTCKGRTDIYIAFIENNLKNLLENGSLSFIIPYAFTNQNYGEASREMIVKNYFIREIVDTSNYMVFSQANVKNIILSLQKTANKKQTQITIAESVLSFVNNNFDKKTIDQAIFADFKGFRFETKAVHDFLPLRDKLWQKAVSLDTICLVAYGARLNHKEKAIGKDAYIHDKNKKGYKPFLEGKNIEKYVYSQYGWLDYKPTEHYNSMFPELFENEKIVCIRIVKDRLRFAYDNQAFYNSHTVINCVRIDKLQTATHITARKAVKEGDMDLAKEYDYMFLLALLNSKIINWYFKNFLSDALNFYPNDAKSLPIIKIDTQDKKQQKTIENIIKQTHLIMGLIEKKKEATTKQDAFSLGQINQRIPHTENEIDLLVLDLYGITDATERDLILNN